MQTSCSLSLFLVNENDRKTVKYTHYLCFSGKKKHVQLPPGPPNLPLVGSLPFLGKDIQEPLRQMALK